MKPIIEENKLIRLTPVYRGAFPTDTYKEEVVITKEEFLACYNAWVKETDDKLLQSLCETCKKYDDCSDSTKISPNFYLLKCRKYEEIDNDQTN